MAYEKNTKHRKYCPKCDKFYSRDNFYKNKSAADGLTGYCKECDKQKNKERKLAQAEYYSDMNKMYKRLRIYGITKEQFEKKMENQGWKCLNCKSDLENNFNIDHDHKCCEGRYSCGNCVRGILCGGCNRGLGFFKDNTEYLKSAIEYLNSHK
jgi:hypothetical protein